MVSTRASRKNSKEEVSSEAKKIRKSSRTRSEKATEDDSMDVTEANTVDAAAEAEQARLAKISRQNSVIEDIFNHCRLIQKSIDIREYRNLGKIIRELRVFLR